MNDKILREINKIEIPKEVRSRSELGIRKVVLESKKVKRKKIIAIIPAMVALASISYFIPNDIFNNQAENPIIKTISTDYVIDVSDPRKVVGLSDNVFVGKVLKQVGTSKQQYPETQFEVEVLNNIKGQLSGTIIVNQAGGYEGDYLFLMEDDNLIKEGETYLFASMYSVETKWHTLIPINNDIIKNDIDKEALIKKYSDAYREEIPFNMGH